jgi:hypothetical protein
MMGWVWIGLGLVYVAVLAARGAGSAWYALAAIPFFLGALGYFQARVQTCVFLAAVGQRNLDSGTERITDGAELSRVRREALNVWLRAVATALVLTMLAFALATLTT